MRKTADFKDLILHLKRSFGDRLDAVVLYGSRARGDFRPNSDWDLLIVVEALPLSPLKRHKIWLKVAPDPWRFLADPMLRTPEEWYGRVVPLTLEIALDGRVLYDARGRMGRFLNAVRKHLKESGLTRRRIQGEILWVWEKGTPDDSRWKQFEREMIK